MRDSIRGVVLDPMINRVAVEEFNLSCNIGEAILSTIYIYK